MLILITDHQLHSLIDDINRLQTIVIDYYRFLVSNRLISIIDINRC